MTWARVWWLGTGLVFLLMAGPLAAAQAQAVEKPKVSQSASKAAAVFTDAEWAAAQTPVSGQPGTSGESPSLGGSLLKIFLSLVFVLALVLASAWILKRLGLSRRGTGKRTGKLEILDALELAPKRAVVVLAIGDQVLVVGHGDFGMNTLATISRAQFDGKVEGKLAEKNDNKPASSTSTEPIEPAAVKSDAGGVVAFRQRLNEVLGRGR